MAKQYDNVNRGALFNDAANKRDYNGRDYSGTINIDGREYWLSGWIKVSKKDGRKYLALSAKPKEAKSNTDDDVGF